MTQKWDKYLLGALILSLALHYIGALSKSADSFILLALSLIGTLPVLLSAFASLKTKKISVDLLASIALVASLLTKEWSSAVFINLMLTSARLFGYYTESKARAAIQSLLKLRPETVNVKRGNQIMKIPVEEVILGDLVVAESGDRLAIDGIVEEGEASIDQSSLTGESVPVQKKKGDEVYSSTLTTSGSLTIKTTKVGKDTTLEKIIALVESSQKEKADIRTTGEKFASWYIGGMLILSISVYVISHDANLLLSLLLVACADDIAIAVPLAFLAAIGYAARRGVIIKGGAYLEGIAKTKILILDKTGTITRGKLAVESITALNKTSEKEMLKLAGIAGSVSEHPIAKSIISHIAKSKISYNEPDHFEEFTGKGVVATYRKKEIVFGNVLFIKERGINITKNALLLIRNAQQNGLTVTLVGYGKKLVGLINSADEVRANAKSAIAKIKTLGVEKIIMLTGDNELVAKKIANEVGVTEYHAALLPQDKLKYIKANLGGGTVTMVGDGVNDAASLALADVGIAMGAIGSDTAIEAANIALMKDNLLEIPETIELGRYTRGVAKQDFWIWGIVNVIGLILVFARIIGPEGSAAFNFITDFFPLINSLRLFNLHLKLG